MIDSGMASITPSRTSEPTARDADLRDTICRRVRPMKRLFLLSCFAALALAQQTGTIQFQHGQFDINADTQRLDAGVYHLAGHVVFENGAMILQADAADFNQTTQEVRPTGNVIIKLK